MAKKIAKTTGGHVSPFERIKHTNAASMEFWSSRDFSEILGYGDYRNFEGVIEKAKMASWIDWPLRTRYNLQWYGFMSTHCTVRNMYDTSQKFSAIVRKIRAVSPDVQRPAQGHRGADLEFPQHWQRKT